MQISHLISPSLWFDNQAEEAAHFYVGIFHHSRLLYITHYTEAGKEFHGKPAGSVMTVSFELNGHLFTALNGGDTFKINEAISFQVNCDTQEEIDYYWQKLSAGGECQQCGWLKDKFGVSWQILPSVLQGMLSDVEEGRAERVVNALLKMQKINIAELNRAYED